MLCSDEHNWLQIKDEAMNFRADNFEQMHATFGSRALAEDPAAGEGGGWSQGRGRGRGRGQGRGRGRGRMQGGGKQDQGDIAADITKILQMIKQRQLEPVIVFSFARR